MNLTDIKTELFTRTTITDFGVRVESFDEITWQQKSSMDIHKPLFIITVNILKSGGVNITTMENKHLTLQQLDEIQRISQILRMEK